MNQDTGVNEVTEDRRKEIFLAVVGDQDQGMGVGESRKLAAQRFGVSENQIRQIEREGMDFQWPPL